MSAAACDRMSTRSGAAAVGSCAAPGSPPASSMFANRVQQRARNCWCAGSSSPPEATKRTSAPRTKASGASARYAGPAPAAPAVRGLLLAWLPLLLLLVLPGGAAWPWTPSITLSLGLRPRLLTQPAAICSARSRSPRMQVWVLSCRPAAHPCRLDRPSQRHHHSLLIPHLAFFNVYMA